MITGSLYNPKRLYPAKANQYLSGFVSQTPNRQGSNSILFNDTNGKEQIEIATTGNKIEIIGKDSRDAEGLFKKLSSNMNIAVHFVRAHCVFYDDVIIISLEI